MPPRLLSRISGIHPKGLRGEGKGGMIIKISVPYEKNPGTATGLKICLIRLMISIFYQI